MKLKFSVSKKIKNSRKEEKVLERLGQSDFENTKRILLLLRSRLEFRSRSSLSVNEELDWIFYNESRTGAGAGNGTDTGNGNGIGIGNGIVVHFFSPKLSPQEKGLETEIRTSPCLCFKRETLTL